MKIEIECKACYGYGIYTGMAERDGSAVVCTTCKGTGKQILEYTPFSERKISYSVTRVVESNPGIVIGESDSTKLEDFGGMSYEDWVQGYPFPPKSENRVYTCPAWWYQGVNYKLKPNWDDCLIVGSFSSCKHFSYKEKCWKRFDRENE